MLLDRTEQILTEDRSQVLALAHALETHKTLSGEDVVAVLEHTRGPLVDGPGVRRRELPGLAQRLSLAADPGDTGEHSQEQLNMPRAGFAAAPVSRGREWSWR